MEVVHLQIGEEGQPRAWGCDPEGRLQLKGLQLNGSVIDLSAIALRSKQQVDVSGLVDIETGKTIYTGKELKLLLQKGDSPQNPIIVTRVARSRDEIKVALLRTFGSRIKQAREGPDGDGDGKLRRGPLRARKDGLLLKDLGQFFDLKQRKLAFRTALMGIVKIFQAIMTPSPGSSGMEEEGEDEDTWLRQALFLIMIAYPGSGKTTFGKMLRQFLVADCKDEGRCVSVCLRKVTSDKQKIFRDMVRDSTKYNLLMYQKLVNDSGNVIEAEEDLHPAQILALRLLFSALAESDKQGYRRFLREVDWDIRTSIEVAEVLDVIRTALQIPEDQMIMFVLFIDEVNAATGKLRRESKNTRGNVTWAQQLFSEYVSFLSANRGGKNFLVLCGATTRHSASSMESTETRQTSSVLLPLPPLTMKKSLEVLTEFHSRLEQHVRGAATPWVVPRHIQELCLLCGGMPRLLSLVLKALVTADRTECVDPTELLASLENSPPAACVRRIVTRLETMVIGKVAFEGYKDPHKFPILERAFAYALLKRPVLRGSVVMAPAPDTWGDLESQGVIALDDYGARNRQQMCSKRACSGIFLLILVLN